MLGNSLNIIQWSLFKWKSITSHSDKIALLVHKVSEWSATPTPVTEHAGNHIVARLIQRWGEAWFHIQSPMNSNTSSYPVCQESHQKQTPYTSWEMERYVMPRSEVAFCNLNFCSWSFNTGQRRRHFVWIRGIWKRVGIPGKVGIKRSDMWQLVTCYWKERCHTWAWYVQARVATGNGRSIVY